MNAGLNPGKDVRLIWLDSHTAAATRILPYTNEIPAEMIVIKRSLDPEIKKRIAALERSVAEPRRGGFYRESVLREQPRF